MSSLHFKVGDCVRVKASVARDQDERQPAFIADIYSNQNTVYLIWKDPQGNIDFDGYYTLEKN